MTTIESEKVTVSSTADDVFAFLSDLNNLQELMPGERVTDWSSTEDTCQFQIKGLARIGMKVIERLPASTIRIGAEGKNPFDFTLTIRIEGDATAPCEAQLTFEADMNPFLKMMAVQPLTNFFNLLATNLRSRYQ